MNESLFVKALAVIRSCKTIDQLTVANNYIRLAGKYITYNAYDLLSNEETAQFYRIQKRKKELYKSSGGGIGIRASLRN